jgi:hypothetical protein
MGVICMATWVGVSCGLGEGKEVADMTSVGVGNTGVKVAGTTVVVVRLLSTNRVAVGTWGACSGGVLHPAKINPIRAHVRDFFFKAIMINSSFYDL